MSFIKATPILPGARITSRLGHILICRSLVQLISKLTSLETILIIIYLDYRLDLILLTSVLQVMVAMICPSWLITMNNHRILSCIGAEMGFELKSFKVY